MSLKRLPTLTLIAGDYNYVNTFFGKHLVLNLKLFGRLHLNHDRQVVPCRCCDARIPTDINWGMGYDMRVVESCFSPHCV